jgi:hypothetical protein
MIVLENAGVPYAGLPPPEVYGTWANFDEPNLVTWVYLTLRLA